MLLRSIAPKVVPQPDLLPAQTTHAVSCTHILPKQSFSNSPLSIHTSHLIIQILSICRRPVYNRERSVRWQNLTIIKLFVSPVTSAIGLIYIVNLVVTDLPWLARLNKRRQNDDVALPKISKRKLML
ncbi:hypothetical protein LSTR_LSTR009603 [Laodelphax striatellus]|uniref:Uncharacterized protein n=1 Tax=Laodelphax striatellus TaxID=195883 RepID=A0A482WZZ4_LAOST|nr:hypothetical protein LSTR_LSTR009603 [Laodelphax striatellus]